MPTKTPHHTMLLSRRSGERTRTLGNLSPSGSRLTIRSGRYAGTMGTLEQMRQLVSTYRGNQAMRDVAVKATRGVKSMRDHDAIAQAVEAFIRRRVRYVKDPVDVEHLTDPMAALAKGYEDCDGMAVLAASMLEALGVPARFTVVSQDKANPTLYSHVFVEYQANDGTWRPLDPSIPPEMAGRQIEFAGQQSFGLGGLASAGTQVASTRPVRAV